MIRSSLAAQQVLPSLPSSRQQLRPTKARAVQTLGNLSPEIESAIEAGYGSCLVQSDLGLGKQTVGKVRDMYSLDEHLVIVTTDRQSAFDRLLAAVPYKGQRCQVFPVEFVVRGFITGSTSTSLWTHYKDGARSYCGNTFPDGLRKMIGKLESNVVTPTTKAADHDEPISPAGIVERGLMSQAELEETMRAALKLFSFGQQEAAQRGLLLVDTKYEFGKSPDGTMTLVDEIHTPDSSRYWLASSYEGRHAHHEEPESIDKEFLRLWFRDNCDPYNDDVLPEAPKELVIELARRYITLFQMITGEPFQASVITADTDAQIAARVVETLRL
ncbi:hypothetical protein WJX84_009219 [Apatococcus fuscideae]|uniref:phosphoribosylaminoimidazolesuccinocarboxamide synthase n=1 Tax=Apatococcus fuscideae TaxID=2026836 RepID=A0AAW1T9I2_9CHLO